MSQNIILYPCKQEINHRFSFWRGVFVFVMFLCVAGPHCYAMMEQTDKYVKNEIARADSLYRCQQYIPALDIYISQLRYPERNEPDSLYLLLLSRIGTIYDIYEDYGRAFYYYEKVLSDANASKYDDIYSKVLVKMVVGYYNSRDTDKMREYYKLQLLHPIRDEQLSNYYEFTNGALMAKLQGRHDDAIALFHKTLAHCESKRMDLSFKVPVMLEMAESFEQLRQNDSVFKYANEAMEIANREELISYSADAYNQLYRYSKAVGDSVGAARFLELYSIASNSADMHKKLDTASIRLLQSHDVQARRKIDSLNERIDFQNKTLIIILAFSVVLGILVIYTRIQHSRLKSSYRLLIEKNDEIFELEDHSAEKTMVELTEPAPEMDNPLLERINAALNDINLISQPSFSLSDLSRQVGSNTKYVSALINEVYNKNFRTILNERRIREATRMLSDTPNYGNCSIAEIAESLGYSSSTVFINAFKKVIGMTPAVYRRYRK